MVTKEPFLLQIARHSNQVVNLGVVQEDGTYARITIDEDGWYVMNKVDDTFDTATYRYVYVSSSYMESKVSINI